MLNVAQSFAFVCTCMLLSFDHQIFADASPTFCVFAHLVSTIDVRITESQKSLNVDSSLYVSLDTYLLMDV